MHNRLILFIVLSTFLQPSFCALEYKISCSEITRNELMNETDAIYVKDYDFRIQEYFNINYYIEIDKKYEIFLENVHVKMYCSDSLNYEILNYATFWLIVTKVKNKMCIYFFKIESESDLKFERYSNIEIRFKQEKERVITFNSQSRTTDQTVLLNIVYTDCVFVTFLTEPKPYCVVFDFDLSIFVIQFSKLTFLRGNLNYIRLSLNGDVLDDVNSMNIDFIKIRVFIYYEDSFFHLQEDQIDMMRLLWKDVIEVRKLKINEE